MVTDCCGEGWGRQDCSWHVAVARLQTIEVVLLAVLKSLQMFLSVYSEVRNLVSEVSMNIKLSNSLDAVDLQRCRAITAGIVRNTLIATRTIAGDGSSLERDVELEWDKTCCNLVTGWNPCSPMNRRTVAA